VAGRARRQHGHTSVKTDVISLADWCEHRRPDRPVVPDPPSEPSGLDGPSLPDNLNAPFEDALPAGSNGDPHLTSFDGHSFNFQAGGEFTLVRSDSGDLEVQARQEPLRRPDGHENTTISVNTAVEIQAGTDRVGIYQHPDRPELRINGQVVAPREAQQLSGGVRIQPDQGGYQLVWPDGSTVWVLPTGSYGLNVMITAAPGRKATMRGLLGPFTGQPRNPAMEDRAGKHYDQVAPAELYKSVGPSWRITQADSLFDYAPGQSTRTFTRVDMPTQILTVDDLTPAQRDAGKRACAGIANQALAQQCEFDVGLTADPEFAAGYQKVAATIDLGSTTTAIGQPIGPTPIEPGQKRTFTFEGGSPETDLYFGTDSDCGTSWAVFWRVTAPGGKDSLLTGMCSDIGRWHTNAPGT